MESTVEDEISKEQHEQEVQSSYLEQTEKNEWKEEQKVEKN